MIRRVTRRAPAAEPGSGGEFDNIPDGYQSRYIDRIAGMSDEQIRTAALICELIIAGFASTGLFLGQLYPEKITTEFSDCAGIADGSERLMCYDKAANQSLTGQFKGAWPSSAAAPSSQ